MAKKYPRRGGSEEGGTKASVERERVCASEQNDPGGGKQCYHARQSRKACTEAMGHFQFHNLCCLENLTDAHLAQNLHNDKNRQDYLEIHIC